MISRLNIHDIAELTPPARFLATGATRAILVLGDAWVIRLLRSSFRGARRFSDFQRELGVSRAVLSDRLERMVSDGLLIRLEAPARHPEYRLSECGLDLWSAFLAMWQWERAWGTGVDASAPLHDRPRNQLVHKTCGAAIDPVFACSHCRESVSPFDTYGQYETFIVQTGAAGAPERKRARKVASNGREELPALLRVYGDRWNSMLVGAAFQGIKTFAEFESATGISPGPLSDRLEELQALGLFRSRAYAGVRREYRLTRAGIGLFPVTIEMVNWGNRWLWKDNAPMHIMHKPCNNRLEPKWYCPACQGTLERASVQLFTSIES